MPTNQRTVTNPNIGTWTQGVLWREFVRLGAKVRVEYLPSANSWTVIIPPVRQPAHLDDKPPVVAHSPELTIALLSAYDKYLEIHNA